MRRLMRVFGQSLIVEVLGRFGVKREVKLIFPWRGRRRGRRVYR